MAFLGKSKKVDLQLVAEELGLTVHDGMKIVELKDLILKSPAYEEEFVKNLLKNVMEERIESQQRAEQEAERQFELDKMRLQLENQRHLETTPPVTMDPEQPRLDLKKLLPVFNPKDASSGDMVLFLNLFERQAKFLKIDHTNWVSYLLSVLPGDVTTLIAREPEEKSQDYQHIKTMLLSRFKLSSEKLRTLFYFHRKNPESTWKDFQYELTSYFESWLKDLNVETFEELKLLMITEQMKKRTPPEVRDHFLDSWSDWITPDVMAEKLDSYENNRRFKKDITDTRRKVIPPKHHDFQKPSYSSKGIPVKRQENSYGDVKTETRPRPYCYGCGAQGVMKSKCTNCNPAKPKSEGSLNHLLFNSFSSEGHPMSIIEVTICDTAGAVCADTGATHNVAGEKLYHLMKEKGLLFKRKNVMMTMADGITKNVEVLISTVDIKVKEKTIPTEMIVLPYATGNRTLLGTTFLKDAGIVLDLQNEKWFFSHKPHESYDFIRNPPHFNTLLMVPDVSPVQLRSDEGNELTQVQKNQMNEVLKRYENCFQAGGEATPFMEHRIDTGDSPPVSVPPYRLNPVKKEILRAEIDKLLANGVIEECESPYAAPVVLIPKPNGSVRLCIDYRKLNSKTVADTYPLPRMDDLLHEARPTPFMSTIDLRSGYHQVKMHSADRDKTAFVCPFGTYRFLRMPFGLKNAPATFQRLIDKFRSGLGETLILSYLDDIIVLSDTFEKHITDLEAVFQRLALFKLNANREKCHFGCSRVKYLGFWITPKGLEVDQEKVSSIQKIPPPTNVKEVQSFLQTCSWFRRYIQNFAEKSKPLSDLTKKKTPWQWGFPQQQAFELLKNCLLTPPILTQADGTKPYILRTDASNYALGAVLLQGHGAEEKVIEYASRLLNQAEQNYSTTEREALAVVWALKKFRGYVEGSSITVATDHQPLKWLLSLKSPTGRLARWALEIQAFNLKVIYVQGKVNVIADLLSRPAGHPAPPVEVNNIVIADLPARSPKEIREAQLQDEDLKKIIECFESTTKTEDYANWTERGFLMDQGILYRYVSDSDSEEAQLVIPTSERESIMKYHHDDATAGHYGEEGTYSRIAKRYYWTGMKKYIAEYVKKCPECNRYKSGNQKPTGLLRTPVYSQRFEVISIDLFGPLPVTENGKQWIFVVEDCATRWVELFALERATAHECATTLIEEVFLRYGIPRRIICDNGPQFTSAVLQQVCHTLKIDHNLLPVYWPQANPVERKNRDLKPRLAILVSDEHDKWHDKLPVIRFAMNTAKCSTTGQTAAFLQFGRELRTVDDVVHNFKAVVTNDNFVAEITPYLKHFASMSEDVQEHIQMKQDQRKKYYDKNRRQEYFAPGDKVWVSSHPISKMKDKKTAKFMPKRDGPYLIMTQNSPTTYTISSLDDPTTPVGRYHVSALKPYAPVNEAARPAYPLRKRGRPKANPATNSDRPSPRKPPDKRLLASRRDYVKARGGV